tara:strand:+ start:1938 stop:2741 length:804 start_codon:yes stop_codon:yes gene_type:complete
VPSQNSHRLAASGDGNDGDDSVSATAGDTRQDDGLDNDTYHPYETQSTYEEESTNDCSTDQALPEQSTAAKADLRVAFTNRGSDPAYARTAGVDVASREIPNRPKMSPFQDTVLNLGLISTAVLLLLGFKKAKTFFDGVPDLPEEERLRRMKVFCETQLKRVAESPESESRNNELKRLTSMKQDIEHKLKKFAAGEAKKGSGTSGCGGLTNAASRLARNRARTATELELKMKMTLIRHRRRRKRRRLVQKACLEEKTETGSTRAASV